MGNTCSCCFRGSSSERHEKQPLQKKGKRSRRNTPLEISEEAVTPDTSTIDSFETLGTNVRNPDVPLEVSQQPAVAPGQADASPTQVKPDAKTSAVNNDSAVDNSLLLQQQEVAARFISKILEDSTKIVAAKNLEVTDEENVLARETEMGHPILESGPAHVNAPSALDMDTFQQRQEVAARFVSKLLTDAAEIVASDLSQQLAAGFVSALLANATKIVAADVFEVAEKGDSLARETDKGDSILVSVNAPSAVDMDKLQQQQQDVAASFVSKLLTDATQIVASYLAQDNGQEEWVACQAESQALYVKSLDTQDKTVLKESQFEAQPAATNGQVAATTAALHSSPQYERPGSADRLTPNSDGSEAWFTGKEDLSDSEEEVEKEPVTSSLEMAVPELDQGSLQLPFDTVVFSATQWREQLGNNIIIRKGYTVLSQSYRCIRQVREDKYSVLRASLYQALMSTSQPPDWLLKDTCLLIPEQLEFRYGLINDWKFPDVLMQMSGVDGMKHCLGLLRKWWHAAATSSGLEGRRRVCEELFRGGEEEFAVLEAVKLLMLARAVGFYATMQRGGDVPSDIRLLFSRDSSSCPQTFLANHLSRIGFSGGVEQMEMFLLACALEHTIKVHRLYKADTGEYITYYPVEHIQDWPSGGLATEDDRHFNVSMRPSLVEMAAAEPDHALDILIFSERQWREQQLDKNIVIMKGYTVGSKSFRCIQQVMEDKYSALRASLYQALMSTSQPPDWLLTDSFLLIPEQLELGVIKNWPFLERMIQLFGIQNGVDRMKYCLGLLQKWWHAAATSSGLEGHRRVCEELFRGGEEEFAVLEALKLLMLARAVEFYTAMQRGEDVPLPIWQLFSRDSSSCPRTFLTNHLSQVGFIESLQQMEMFLLGYALEHTIKVYRLHRADTEEFVSEYPEHLQDWPSVCLVTEDDLHFNVLVGDPTHGQP